eukprot:5455591-Pyramimonas_sp.AAC.1
MTAPRCSRCARCLRCASRAQAPGHMANALIRGCCCDLGRSGSTVTAAVSARATMSSFAPEF